MKRVSIVLFLTTFIALAGCAPDPAEMCEHMMEIMKNDPERPRFLEDEKKCVDRMEKVKKRHGVNSYRREVECALGVDTAYKLRTCMAKEAKKRDGPTI